MPRGGIPERILMGRNDGNTPHRGGRRHHKAMHSGSHGGGHCAKVRAAKKTKANPGRPARKTRYLADEVQ